MLDIRLRDCIVVAEDPGTVPAFGKTAGITPFWGGFAPPIGSTRRHQPIIAIGACDTIPRHRGNSEHPQNWPPAFAPRRAVRNTIGLSHFGQFGDGSEAGVGVSLMSPSRHDRGSLAPPAKPARHRLILRLSHIVRRVPSCEVAFM